MPCIPNAQMSCTDPSAGGGLSPAGQGQPTHSRLQIVLICLRIAPQIVAAGNTRRPGRKGMEGWNTERLICSPDLGDWVSTPWEGIEQVFRLERTVRLLKTNQTRHEVVYGLSSLSIRQAPPARMLSLVRGHWAIENKLHYRRDVRLGEDACQTRDFTGAWPAGSAQ